MAIMSQTTVAMLPISRNFMRLTAGALLLREFGSVKQCNCLVQTSANFKDHAVIPWAERPASPGSIACSVSRPREIVVGHCRWQEQTQVV